MTFVRKYINIFVHLNSNIEIHKLKDTNQKLYEENDLNSNIEIHKLLELYIKF